MKTAALLLWSLAFASTAWAGNLDTIGVSLLRQVTPSLDGSNVPVAQVEAALNTNSPPQFEVNPASAGQPESLFTYTTTNGVATNFPNSLGAESWHAANVAKLFYAPGSGVAPNVAHVDNYHADSFFNAIIDPVLPSSPQIPESIVNQSFIFDNVTDSDRNQIEQSYDDYADKNNVLFISGAGNSGRISPPGTAFNGIGVAVIDGSSSHGPTVDGRSKPDITAPGGATSYSAPYVSGVAVLLSQAAARNDGGSGTATSANDSRTLKALLLNGAVNPVGWTNSPANPLDARYGAGLLNAFNSWHQLKGGEHAFIESTTVNSGSEHPPGNNTSNESTLSGWDLNSISTFPTQDRVNHYYFDLPEESAHPFLLTATLVWNRHAGRSDINNLDLFLYNTANDALVICSTSAVDNLEHIFVPQLSAGRYDLQVVKRDTLNPVSASETYALAFEFTNPHLDVTQTTNSALLSWPLSPAGLHLESTTNLNPPAVWLPVTNAVSVNTNAQQNTVSIPLTGDKQYFRLQGP